MEPVLPQIEHVIYLMLENRSFDNLLGWLYHDPAGPQPQVVYPTGSPQRVDGLHEGMSNARYRDEVAVALGTQDMAKPFRQPRWDPHEGMANVYKQMYADGDGVIHDPDGLWGPDAPMTGFAYDFPEWGSSRDSMGAYSREQLPVLYGLAENFAVSDRYFSSVPTMTDPNRAFSIMGTSLGRVQDLPEKTFPGPTLFDVLYGRKEWAIFWQNRGHVLHPFDDPPYPCETVMRFDGIGAIPDIDARVHHYDVLLDALESGTGLPEFSYVEPYWGAGFDFEAGLGYVGVQGNDYHPPTWVGPAEWYLNQLYVALRASDYWDKTLLILNFDEHGGTYDHVSPTQTVAPDEHTPDFRFQRLGVRVPMLLISPFIHHGTVFRADTMGTDAPQADLDHTSTIATILAWAGVDPAAAGLGRRVAGAPRFDHVLSDHIAQPDAICGFDPPDSYRDQAPLGLHLLPDALSELGVELDVAFSPHDLRMASAVARDPASLVAELRRLVGARGQA